MSTNNEKFKVYLCTGGNFEFINNCPMYMPIDCYRVPLKLPIAPEKPMTCRILLRNILKKLGLPLDAQVCIKYIMDNFVLDITDDEEDFRDFLLFAINNQPVEIYVVEMTQNVHGRGRDPHASSSSGQQPYQNNDYQPYMYNSFNLQGMQYPYSPMYDPNQISTSFFQNYGQNAYYQANITQMNPYNPYNPTTNYQETFPTKRDTSFQENNETHNYHETFPTPHPSTFPEYNAEIPNSYQSDSEHDDMENLNPEKKIEHPWCNAVVEDDGDDNETDEDLDPKQPYDKPIPCNPKPVDIFWNMPPLLCDIEKEVKPRSVTIYELSDLVKVGQTFENKEEFLLQLRTKCLHEGFQISPVYSDKTRYTAKCSLPKCEWRISARCIQQSDNFQVRKMNDIHTCSTTQILPNNKHANKKVLGNILKELMTQAGRVYRGKDIQVDMSSRFKISLSYNQAWRAKCYAIELLRGSAEDSFRSLPAYLHNLKLKNPGSVTNILTDDEDRFVMSYMSIGAAVSYF